MLGFTQFSAGYCIKKEVTAQDEKLRTHTSVDRGQLSPLVLLKLLFLFKHEGGS